MITSSDPRAVNLLQLSRLKFDKISIGASPESFTDTKSNLIPEEQFTEGLGKDYSQSSTTSILLQRDSFGQKSIFDL